MKEIIELLNQLWSKNADKAEYMICGTPELDLILEENNRITDALKILNSETEEITEP